MTIPGEGSGDLVFSSRQTALCLTMDMIQRLPYIQPESGLPGWVTAGLKYLLARLKSVISS